MKTIYLLSALLIGTISYAQNSNDRPEWSGQSLVGEWLIDLRPTPDAEPYFQVFAVEQVNDNTLTGSFYSSPIADGFVNANWSVLYFAFTTEDGTHSYYHSGKLVEGKLQGTTYCPGRALIAQWTGERKQE